jgi:hypothetical protein
MKCSLVILLSSEYCKEVFLFPEFEPFLVKVMAGPSKSMRLDDDELWDELQKEFSVNSESEFSDDSDCDMVVKPLSGSEQSNSSGDKDYVNAGSDMKHGTWTKVGAERPHFPFSGRPGLKLI